MPSHGRQRAVLDAVNLVAVAPYPPHFTGGAVSHPHFQLPSFVPCPGVPIAIGVYRERSVIHVGLDGQVEQTGVVAGLSPVFSRRQRRKFFGGPGSVEVVAARLLQQQSQVHAGGILKAFLEVARNPDHVQSIGDDGLTKHVGDVLPHPMADPAGLFTRGAVRMDQLPAASDVPYVQRGFR